MRETRIGRRSVLAGSAALAATTLAGPLKAEGQAQAAPGTLTHWKQIPGRNILPRDVDIWVPDGVSGPLPVLYVQDGQNAFDPVTSYDDHPLEMDIAMAARMALGKEPAIVVAIWNTDDRSREYNASSVMVDLPPPTRDAIERSCGGRLLSAAYLKWLTEDLKPKVDAAFNTRPERESTFCYGVSMGGLICLEAMATRPDIFGGAIAMSAHSFLIGPLAQTEGFEMPEDTFPTVLGQLSSFGARIQSQNSRLWLDRGTIELDEYYKDSHTAIEHGLTEAGWTDQNLKSVVFEGTGHHGRYWTPRIPAALDFVLG